MRSGQGETQASSEEQRGECLHRVHLSAQVSAPLSPGMLPGLLWQPSGPGALSRCRAREGHSAPHPGNIFTLMILRTVSTWSLVYLSFLPVGKILCFLCRVRTQTLKNTKHFCSPITSKKKILCGSGQGLHFQDQVSEDASVSLAQSQQREQHAWLCVPESARTHMHMCVCGLRGSWLAKSPQQVLSHSYARVNFTGSAVVMRSQRARIQDSVSAANCSSGARSLNSLPFASPQFPGLFPLAGSPASEVATRSTFPAACSR